MIQQDVFPDRATAGRQLAEGVAALALPDPLVLALPRGGVAVAAPVAARLGAPLDVLLVRKIGAPGFREFAVGAVVEGPAPIVVLDDTACARAGADRAYIDEQVDEATAEIARRRARYAGGRRVAAVAGRSVVVVDDGIATGATMRAALRALRMGGAARVVVAVPVAPADTVAALRPLVDEVVCLSQPPAFRAVGLHYADFHQMEDDEVVALLGVQGQA